MCFNLLYIKGFNFTMIFRIRITDFKSGFSKLIIKKSKTMKYAIPSLLKKKLEEISMNKDFASQFFFYNNISENKNNRSATFKRNIFKNIINNSFGIEDERKIEILNILSSKRKPKINFNDNVFFLMTLILLYTSTTPVTIIGNVKGTLLYNKTQKVDNLMLSLL